MAALMPDWQKMWWLIPLNIMASHEVALAGMQVSAGCGSGASLLHPLQCPLSDYWVALGFIWQC